MSVNYKNTVTGAWAQMPSKILLFILTYGKSYYGTEIKKILFLYKIKSVQLIKL